MNSEFKQTACNSESGLETVLNLNSEFEFLVEVAFVYSQYK